MKSVEDPQYYLHDTASPELQDEVACHIGLPCPKCDRGTTAWPALHEVGEFVCPACHMVESCVRFWYGRKYAIEVYPRVPIWQHLVTVSIGNETKTVTLAELHGLARAEVAMGPVASFNMPMHQYMWPALYRGPRILGFYNLNDIQDDTMLKALKQKRW